MVHTVSDARMPGCLLKFFSKYSLNFKKDAILRFATDVYLVEKEQKEDAVEKMRRYFVTRNLNVHTRHVTMIFLLLYVSLSDFAMF